mmetsp:Transcript_23356/g.59634  ORF Transcript_23356/g.59634 Transcript_23356/m.59634 type:complete len:175 (-) Transcript_23356:64-588(-)
MRDPKYHHQVYQNGNHLPENGGAPSRPSLARCRLSHCVVACLVRGGKVVTPGFAMCSEASPRLRPHVARLLGGQQPRTMTQHAEIAALNLLPEGISLRQLQRMTLVVIRPKYSQKLRQTRMLCAQPCRECANIIDKLGIKMVVYSSENMLHRRTPSELMLEALPSSGTEWLIRS